MSPPDTALVLLAIGVVATGCSALARRSALPYPVALVVVGLVLSFVPALPKVSLPPDLVLLGILPPIVYYAAFTAAPREMAQRAGSILLLATGLVVATAAAVATIARLWFGLPLAAAAVLGTVLGPTDPVAAVAVMRRLHVGTGLRALIEGEGLANDGVALVLYASAVEWARGARVGAGHVVVSLAQGIGVGIVVGLAVGWVARQVRTRIHDAPIEVAVSLLIPYCAYLPAQQLGGSGVLAALSSGLLLGWRGAGTGEASSRIEASSFWEVFELLLNTTLFVMIGLELRALLPEIRPHLPTLVAWSAATAGVVLLLRFAWLFTTPYLLARFPRLRAELPTASERVVITSSGMRGAVSLAAALAVPLTADDGGRLVGRQLIIAITFGVVVATLLVQGSTLSWVIQRLPLPPAARGDETLRARSEGAERALIRLDEITEADGGDAAVDALREEYERKLERRRELAGGDQPEGRREVLARERSLRRELLEVERETARRLRNGGELSGSGYQQVMRTLDLETARWEGGSASGGTTER